MKQGKKEENFVDWLHKRPVWQVAAAKAVLDGDPLSDAKIQELAQLSLREMGRNDVLSAIDVGEEVTRLTHPETAPYMLTEVSKIKGVNALDPHDPLRFTSDGLTVIYGGNGSGKSGYVRALKHLSGHKKKGELFGNVFTETQDFQTISLGIKTATGKVEVLEHSLQDGPHPNLLSMRIYDSEGSGLFLNEESEIAYEPPLLRFLSDLTQLTERVADELKRLRTASAVPFVDLPLSYADTGLAVWLRNLDHETTNTEILSRIAWTDNDNQRLHTYRQLLSDTNIEPRLDAYQAKRALTSELIEFSRGLSVLFSQESLSDLINLANAKLQAETIAAEGAKVVFSSSPLAGIGAPTWKALWEAARKYSEGLAYPTEPFPNTAPGAHCVLCMQPLDNASADRLKQFEAFINGDLESAAATAKAQYTQRVEKFAIPGEEVLTLKVTGALGMTETATDFQAFVRQIRKSIADIQSGNIPTAVDLSLADQVVANLRATVTAIDQEIVQLHQSQNPAERGRLMAEIPELECRQFLNMNSSALLKHAASLREQAAIDSAIESCNTTALTKKKASLSEHLLTERFRQQFDHELETLGARHLKVEIKQKRATKQAVYYTVQLKARHNLPIGKILSEGEFRVASLAAFFAEATLSNLPLPVVFDDPINSLDTDYEELVAKRVFRLATNQQVIVFTHRISFLSAFDQLAKEADRKLSVIHLTREAWGTGQPGETPLYGQRPESALNTLLERAKRAGKILGSEGSEIYYPLGKALCSDFRILLERFTEEYLLQGIVVRYKRSVQSLRIKQLTSITPEDIGLIDAMMTKYSYYEHSQPIEAPVRLPQHTEIEKDMSDVKSWFETNKQRLK